MLIPATVDFIGAFAAYSLGANNIANVVGVFVPVSPFKDLRMGSLFVFEALPSFILSCLAIVVGSILIPGK